VIGSSLARNPSPGKLVARVTLLGADGYQKNFEATLVGADRTKDLAVLKVCVPFSFRGTLCAHVCVVLFSFFFFSV
jgi:hypothetical protein